MKRFLVFCTICIVTACLGLLTFRFLTLEETLTVNQTTFEINIGEEVPLEIKREHIKSSSTITYESSDPEIVDYDKTLDKFVSNGKGGKVTLRIESSVRTIAPISIFVTVGDGSEQCPFYIKSAEDLAEIGKVDENGACNRKLSDCYALLSDIDLSTYNNGVWTPIGSGSDEGFTGIFNGKGHTISNLSVSGDGLTYAGLFAVIGKNSTSTDNVYSLNITNANIDGKYNYAGALAGKIDGKARNIIISTSTVSSTLDQGAFSNKSYVGQLCGQLTGQVERISALKGTSKTDYGYAGGVVGSIESASSLNAQLDRSYAEGVDVSGTGYLGGVAGLNKGAVIVDCYAIAKDNGGRIKNVLSKAEKSYLGGLVGYVDFYGDKTAVVVDGYATSSIEMTNDSASGYKDSVSGQLVGCLTYTKTTGTEAIIASKNDLLGLYYAQSCGINGLGVIKTGSSESVPSTDDISVELTKFVNNTLDTEAKGLEVVKIFSHDNGKTGSAYDSWNWEIGNVWVLTEEYPILNINGPYFDVSDLISSVVASNVIDSFEKLATLRTEVNNGVCDYSKPYIIKADILIEEENWTSIGTETNPFSGKIMVAKNESGEPYKITGLTRSLFGYVNGDAKIDGIVIEKAEVEGENSVGAIANYNRGTIENCQVISSVVKSKGSNKEEYVGGLVGQNYGTIQNSKLINSTVKHTGPQDSTSLYIGGIAGGALANSRIYSCGVSVTVDEKLIGLNTEYGTTSNVGGIVGSNQGKIEECYVGGKDQKVIIKILDKKSYLGGIAGNNDADAEIINSYCNAYSLQGYNVGGIVGNTSGKVKQCDFEGFAQGHYLGGIAYQISKGVVENCYTDARLSDDGSGAVITSLVYRIGYINGNGKDDQPTIKHCYSSCNFNHDNGSQAYYETQPNARFVDSNKKNNVGMGYIINCVYNRDVAEGASRSYYPYRSLFGWNLDSWNESDHPDISASEVVNGSSYVKRNNEGEVLDGNGYYLDIGLTESDINSNESQVFNSLGFSTDIWSFGGDAQPYLKNIQALKAKFDI